MRDDQKTNAVYQNSLIGKSAEQEQTFDEKLMDIVLSNVDVGLEKVEKPSSSKSLRAKSVSDCAREFKNLQSEIKTKINI